MRIIGGEWRGRTLLAPPGLATRPTADRVRQALFDMLLHAPWGGRETLEGARVLDAFAGSGALGLEALSRGAAHTTFVERDRAASETLRTNVARCRAEGRSTILVGDMLTLTRTARARGSDEGFGLVFLDPPYGEGLVGNALAQLRAAGWLAPGALVVAETARNDKPDAEPLAERVHGAARLTVWREC